MDVENPMLFLEQHVLKISFLGGLIWYIVHDFILTPYVLIPSVYKACGVVKADSVAQEKQIEQKIPFFLGKGVYSILMWCSWIWFAKKFPGWEDWTNWPVYCERLPLTHPEFRTVIPLYIMYFSYAFWVFFKDIFKPRKGTNWTQYLFDFHHLLAIALTYYSIIDGYWRGGFLTRLIHDPTDIVLYNVKVIEGVYKMRTGKQTGTFLLICVTFVLAAFVITRVFIYGLFNKQVVVMMMLKDSITPIDWALLIGTIAMYLLQIVFAANAVFIVKNYCKGEEALDFIHSQQKGAFGSPSKEKEH